jgi:molecular chaperone HtpG
MDCGARQRLVLGAIVRLRRVAADRAATSDSTDRHQHRYTRPMTVEAHKETLEFKAEVSQVLDLVIRSLYSNKEIFLRELISNASDAAEKLRFEALTDEQLLEDDPESARARAGRQGRRHRHRLRQRHRPEPPGGHRDHRQHRQLRHAAFVEALQNAKGEGEDQANDDALIGQFGVGFYSAYIVADKVTLISRRAGLTAEHGVRWESDGRGSYTLETVEKPAAAPT